MACPVPFLRGPEGIQPHQWGWELGRGGVRQGWSQFKPKEPGSWYSQQKPTALVCSFLKYQQQVKEQLVLLLYCL